MTSLRTHLEQLREVDDLIEIEERIHWDEEAATTASEALRHDGPALLFETTPGRVQFTSGVYSGPDKFTNHEQYPWRRISQSFGLGIDNSYGELVAHIARQETRSPDDLMAEPVATPVRGADLYSLGLPTVGDEGHPLVTLGLVVAEREGTTTWAPIRGEAQRSETFQLSVPRSFAEWCDPPSDVSIVLGLSAPPLVAALQGWTNERDTPSVPNLAAGMADVAMATVDSRIVPAEAEVRIDGQMSIVDEDTSGPRAAWEWACDVTTVELQIREIAPREEPVVAFTPLGAPLTDDVQLMCLVEAAQLTRRVNNYWGVSPVQWVQLPVEARMGLCIVSSEILYAGFEWQLANTLFSFSNLFDKVLVLDERAEPADIARAVDDMWVKAHPANDWIFSDPNAPSAATTRYRRDGETGSQLYINATWDPRWDEEYIAPRVTFETSFSEDVLTALGERWEELGLDDLVGSPPEADRW